jgi:hypothetical protein
VTVADLYDRVLRGGQGKSGNEVFLLATGRRAEVLAGASHSMAPKIRQLGSLSPDHQVLPENGTEGARGQLIANGRIPIQAIVASIEADQAAAATGD